MFWKTKETHNDAVFADTGPDNRAIYLGEAASKGARGYTHPPSKHHWQKSQVTRSLSYPAASDL